MKKLTKQEWSAKVAYLRDNFDMSREEFANFLGFISASSIYRWEKGISIPSKMWQMALIEIEKELEEPKE